LKDDGILIIQTPCYPEDKNFDELQSLNHPFLAQFKPTEHLFLFSKTSIQQFLQRCNLPHIYFEPALFGMYDMFVVASATPLQINTQEAIDRALLSASGGRMVLALLDKDAECRNLNNHLQESESDRAARLDQVHQYDIWLKESQAMVNELQAGVNELRAELTKFNSSLIYKIGRRLGMF